MENFKKIIDDKHAKMIKKPEDILNVWNFHIFQISKFSKTSFLNLFLNFSTKILFENVFSNSLNNRLSDVLSKYYFDVLSNIFVITTI